MLRNEARVMEGLHSLGIEGLSLHNVLKLNIQPSDSDYAVDIRSPAISVCGFHTRDNLRALQLCVLKLLGGFFVCFSFFRAMLCIVFDFKILYNLRLEQNDWQSNDAGIFS